MKFARITIILVALTLFHKAFCQDELAPIPLRLPLTAVEADSIKIKDFFWHLQMKDVEAAGISASGQNNAKKKKKAPSEKDWQKDFETLDIESGINGDKDNVTAIANFAQQSGQLLRATGDSRYAKAMEHCYYNGLAGRMKENDEGKRKAAADALRQFTSEVMATSGKHLFINMFPRSQSHIKTSELNVETIITTSVPWFNEVFLQLLTGGKQMRMALHLKVPEWLGKEFLPNYDMGSGRKQINVFVKGEKIVPHVENGYVVIDREWEDSTVVVLNFPTPTRRIHQKNKPDETALMKGSLLYTFLNIPEGMYIKENDPVNSQFDKDRHTNVLSAPYYNKNGEKAGIYLAEPYLFNRHNPQARIFVPALKPGTAKQP